MVSEHSILSAPMKVRDATMKFMEEEWFNSVPEWKENLEEIKQFWERRPKGERAKREGRQSWRDHAPCRKRVRRGAISQKLHEICLDQKLRRLQKFYVTERSEKPNEEEDTEPEAAASETEESEEENDGIAGEYYGGDDEDDRGVAEMTLEEVKWDEEPKWDSGGEEPSTEEELLARDLGEPSLYFVSEACNSEIEEKKSEDDEVRFDTVPLYDTDTEEDEWSRENDEIEGSSGVPWNATAKLEVDEIGSDRAWKKKVRPEGTHEKEEGSCDTDRKAAATAPKEGNDVAAVENEWLVRDEEEQFSRSLLACDLFGEETTVEWSSTQVDLVNSLGQAQHLILAPTKLLVSTLDPFNIERSLSTVIAEKDKKLIGFGWFQKKVDFTPNPMGQAHNFINTPPIFTNTGRTLQVVHGLNSQRDQLFNIFPLFSKILREEREVESGRIFYNGFELLFKGVKLIKLVVGVGGSYCSGIMQLKENSIMKFLFVLQWDPGGFTIDEWSPSGIKGDENLQESATTSAMKCHEVQTHQYHEVFLNFQQNIKVLLHHFMEEQAWVIKIVVPATVYKAQTAPLLLWDPFFNNFLPLRQYTGLAFTVESFMAFLNFCIEDSATSEASVQEYKKLIESQEWIHNCYCVQSESEIPQGDIDLIYGWLKEYVSDSIRTVENELIGVEHLVQGSESSRMPSEEAHHKQRDPSEHFSDFCSIGTLCFKLWDPGGRPSSLLFFRYLHLEDKVNFEGGSIDENLGYTNPRQTNRFGKIYSRRGKKGNSGLVMIIGGRNSVTNSA